VSYRASTVHLLGKTRVRRRARTGTMTAVGPAGQGRGPAGRPRGRAGLAAAVFSGGLALLTMVGTAAATAGTDRGTAAERALPGVLVVLVLAGPVTAAVAAWWVRTDRPQVAVGLAVAAGSTAVPLWAGWPALPDTVRAVALAVPAVAVAGTAQTALRWSPHPGLGHLRLTYALGVAAVVVHVAGYDPLADISCARTCAQIDPPLGFVLSPRLAVLLVGALTLTAVVVAGAGLRKARAWAVPPALRASAGVALCALAAAAVLQVAGSGGPAVQGGLVVLRPVSVLPVAVAVAVTALRTARVRAAVARVIDQLVPPAGRSAGRTPLLGDVHFAVTADGPRWVDAEGRDVDARTVGASVILQDSSGPAVRLVPATRVDEDAVIAGLTPARRMAMDIARLTAVARAHLADTRASQRRVVARADIERRRIERDLHDGVQQRLVSAALHVGAARSRTSGRPDARLLEVDAGLRRALGELRRISRGVFPEGPLDEGLEVALDELVRESDHEATLRTSGVLFPGPEIAMAVYATVRAVLESGSRSPGAATVQVDVTGGLLTTVVQVPGALDPSCVEAVQDVADRVGAVGGHVRCRTVDGRTTVTAVIPCG
jgi:signal transduction histidine kinase